MEIVVVRNVMVGVMAEVPVVGAVAAVQEADLTCYLIMMVFQMRKCWRI